MSDIVIKVENISKKYMLGVISYGTIRHDIQSWWARIRGKEDPNLPLHMKGKNLNEDFWALRDVSFEIKRGERFGIIGNNGAGKSTLLKILSKVTLPTMGMVKLKGKVASLLEVGTGFHPELTGRENIYLNGAILGMKKQEIDRKFDEMVAFAGVEKFIDTPVKRYSSGMYVRLGFSVAAHLEPDILIVDEVLAVGDVQFQKKCLGKMEDVSKNEGRTILFVSHNMGAINTLCQKAILLSNGKIKSAGDTESIIAQYLDLNFAKNSKVVFDHKPDIPIYISKVNIYDADGKSSLNLDMLKKFRVEIEYNVNEVVSNVMISCAIFASNHEECIFSTTDVDLENSKFTQRRNAGIHLTYVDIPGNFLNSGTYRLVIGISSPGKALYDRQEALTFNLFDSGSFVIKYGGEERRNSLLLIGLPWNENNQMTGK